MSLPDSDGLAVINSPAELQLEIDRLCRGLDAGARELGIRISELADAELSYGDIRDEALVQLFEDLDGKRLPGEDIRRALIHRSPDVRERHHAMRRLERRVEALEKWSRKVEKELSGRQSQLNSLLSEDRAASARG
jgi:hypothetical protein